MKMFAVTDAEEAALMEYFQRNQTSWTIRAKAQVFRGLGEEPTPETSGEYWDRRIREKNADIKE